MSRGPASGMPASGRPAEPYQPGNLVSFRNGAHSIQLVSKLAQTLVDALLDARPDLTAYPWAVGAWARAETRCLLLDRYVETSALVDGSQASRLGSDIARFERLAAQHRQVLGLDPRSEAELLRARREAVEPGEVLRGVLEAGRLVMAEQAARVELEAGP